METQENIVVKKSSLHAKDSFDYQKLVRTQPYLIPCEYEESEEEVTFKFDMSGLTSLKEIKKEEKITKYRILINFKLLEDLVEFYDIKWKEENLYFDENGLIYVKERDLYEVGKAPGNAEFLEAYKCIVGGNTSGKYTVKQLQESGSGVLKAEKNLSYIEEAPTVEELNIRVRKKKEEIEEKQRKTTKVVAKKPYFIWRVLGIATLVLSTWLGVYSLYTGMSVVPKQRSVIEGTQAFVVTEYLKCIDALKPLEVEEMDATTKYILAVSYANAESFQKEEINVIVSRLSPSSNQKELEYWIYLGRLDVQKAQDLALTLSDDKLLIYAYMKEVDLVEGDTTLDGAEKKSRLDTLEGEISGLIKKYDIKEEK